MSRKNEDKYTCVFINDAEIDWGKLSLCQDVKIISGRKFNGVYIKTNVEKTSVM